MGAEAHLELVLDELIGNAVIVAVDLDVIIDIDRGFFPLALGPVCRRCRRALFGWC